MRRSRKNRQKVTRILRTRTGFQMQIVSTPTVATISVPCNFQKTDGRFFSPRTNRMARLQPQFLMMKNYHQPLLHQLAWLPPSRNPKLLLLHVALDRHHHRILLCLDHWIDFKVMFQCFPMGYSFNSLTIIVSSGHQRSVIGNII